MLSGSPCLPSLGSVACVSGVVWLVTSSAELDSLRGRNGSAASELVTSHSPRPTVGVAGAQGRNRVVAVRDTETTAWGMMW